MSDKKKTRNKIGTIIERIYVSIIIKLENLYEWLRWEPPRRYHFCDKCGKFMIRKNQHCKKCRKISDNWTDKDWEAYFADDYDPIEYEEMFPNRREI